MSKEPIPNRAMNGAGRLGLRRAIVISCCLTASAWGASPERWALDYHDCPLQILRNERVVNAIPTRTPSRNSQADHYQVRTGLGTRLDFVAPLPPTPMIDELTVDVCMRSDRPGAQMLLRVVLPRSTDPTTGQLTTVTLPGPRYTMPGTWQTLRMEKLMQPLEDQVRILRSQRSRPLDRREAYINAVVINGYDGAGETDLWFGDPRVDDLPPVQQASLMQPLPPFVTEHASRPAIVQTRGGILEVDGVPFFARVIEEQGEEWSYLHQLGFNTVRLQRPVTVQDLAAAERHGLWIIARPPSEQEWPLIEDHCGRVLIWDLSDDPRGTDPAHLRHLAESLQIPTKRHVRPFASKSEHGSHPPTRIQIVIRPSVERPATDALVRQSMAFRDNRPWWGTVPTDLSESMMDQLSWFGVDSSKILLEEEQIQQGALAAVRAGARGLLFRSTQRLDAANASARQRSLSLQQLNASLDTIAPWLSAGISELQIEEGAVQRVSNGTPFSRRLEGVVLQKPLGSLAILAQGQDQPSFVPYPRTDSGYVVTVKGPSVIGEVVYLAPDVVRRLPSRGVPGGIAVSLDRPQSTDYLVFANDTSAVEELARRWTRGHAQRLDRALALASYTINDTERVVGEVPNPFPHYLDAMQTVERARAEITRAYHARDQKNWMQAWTHLRQAQTDTSLARRQTWDHVLQGQRPYACPLTMQFGLLADYLRWRQSHSFAISGWNVLPEGNCDDFTEMCQAGWQWRPGRSDDDSSVADVPQVSNFQKRPCLQLMRHGDRPSSNHCESSKWISPAISLSAGQFIRIQGWINVPPAVLGKDHHDSIELRVYDSYAGPELAERLRGTNGWEQLTMYRAVSSDQPLKVTFELSGNGSVYLDEWSVVVGH